MTGITFIMDGTNDKERLEDLFDIFIAESRKDEESISWEEIKKNLKKEGKI
jgi:hypothetical protein